MKSVIAMIALWGGMAWPQLQAGSVIFLDFEKEGITLSSDSKTVSVETHEVRSECKISAFGDKFAFQIAGLIKDASPNGWDVRLIARKIWKSESLHESDAAKLVQTVSDKWIAETRNIYSDPEYIRHKRHSHPESPVIANVVFAATDDNGHLALRAINVIFDVRTFDSTGTVRPAYLAKDVSSGEWLSAGSNDIIMEFMPRISQRAKEYMSRWDARTAKLGTSARQAALAREMIELSIRLHPHPDDIGPPVEVLQIIPKTGVQWIANEDKCQ
jgi:hypothetical protein